MDIYCPICAEPFDNDELHDVAEALQANPPMPGTVGAMLSTGTSYGAVAAAFRKYGCKVLEPTHGPQPHCKPAENGKGEIIAEVYALMGGDMDGAATFLEDAQDMGLI